MRCYWLHLYFSPWSIIILSWLVGASFYLGDAPIVQCLELSVELLYKSQEKIHYINFILDDLDMAPDLKAQL